MFIPTPSRILCGLATWMKGVFKSFARGLIPREKVWGFIFRQDGFVAIVCAVVVTVFLLGIVILVGQSGFSGYSDSQAIEAKSVGFRVAEGCLRHALLYLAAGSYEGDEPVSVGSHTCQVLPIEFGASTITIKASSTVRGALTNLKLVVDSYTLDTLSFTEVSGF